MHRVQMVRHKRVRELVSGDGHRQKLRNSVRKEGFFEDFAHAGALMWLLDQHFSDDALQVI